MFNYKKENFKYNYKLQETQYPQFSLYILQITAFSHTHWYFCHTIFFFGVLIFDLLPGRCIIKAKGILVPDA